MAEKEGQPFIKFYRWDSLTKGFQAWWAEDTSNQLLASLSQKPQGKGNFKSCFLAKKTRQSIQRHGHSSPGWKQRAASQQSLTSLI